jgi:alcohol dehydrogenase
MDLLRDVGYDQGIVRSRNFNFDLKHALSGRELNLVMEATGGQYFRHSYKALAPMGRIIAYGSAEFTPVSDHPNYFTLIFKYLFRPRIDPLTMIRDNKSVMGFNLIWLYERKELLKALLDEIDTLDLPPPLVGHRFPFIKMHEALRLFKSGRTTGKLVLTF